MRLLLLPILLAACAGIEPQTETGRALSAVAADAALRRIGDAVGDLCLPYEAMLDARAAGRFDPDHLTPDERSMWATLDRHCAAPQDRIF